MLFSELFLFRNLLFLVSLSPAPSPIFASLFKKVSQTFDQDESSSYETKDGTEVVYPQSGIVPSARVFVVYRALEELHQKTHHIDKRHSK